jgi:hypothetical protein
MPAITVDQLKRGLRTIRTKGAVILTIRALTTPELIGDHPYQGKEVVKEYTANFILGANWEDFKQRQREKKGGKGKFRAGPHAWATYVDSCILTNREGTKEYLRLIHRARISEGFAVDGEQIDASNIEPWIRPPRGEYRNVYLDNIISITWGGETYTVL